VWFSIVVACGIFIIAWNSRHFAKSSYLLFIGIAYLFVGCLDLTHTLAYKGMGVFVGYGANLSTQLWIVGRYVESISLLGAAFWVGRKLRANFAFIGYAIITFFLLGSIFYWNVFPVCYIEGSGLTTFKIVSEYIISFILIASVIALYQKRHEFEKRVLQLLIGSIMITVVSELAFTLYADVYGLFNLIGHYLKIVSFYLIYKAVVETGLKKPYTFFFKNLKHSEDILRADKDRLEHEVDESEAKLHEAELNYRTLADSTYDWVYWENPNGTFRYVSPSCERITGYKPEDFMENPQILQKLLLPEDEVRWNEHRQEAFDNKGLHEVQIRICKRDGQIRWLEHVCKPVIDKEGEFLGIRVSNRDITYRKQTENEVHQLREQYLHIARVNAMGELTASLAHELKQPLAAIRSNAQAAQRFLTSEKPDLDEFHEVLADIIKDNRRANEVISRLRILMRKGNLQITRLNINELIQEIFPLVHSYEMMRNISLEFEFDDRIRPVAADRVQLQQVILNLLLNSSEALMNVDRDSRKVAVQTSQKDSQNVIVTIKDNGPGIDEQIREYLFEPFYTTKQEGMGMGLPISRSIVESHGGSLWVENNFDHGATFYFTIPVFNRNKA
jgi:PAS domain S-box-containing protein